MLSPTLPPIFSHSNRSDKGNESPSLSPMQLDDPDDLEHEQDQHNYSRTNNNRIDKDASRTGSSKRKNITHIEMHDKNIGLGIKVENGDGFNPFNKNSITPRYQYDSSDDNHDNEKLKRSHIRDNGSRSSRLAINLNTRIRDKARDISRERLQIENEQLKKTRAIIKMEELELERIREEKEKHAREKERAIERQKEIQREEDKRIEKEKRERENWLREKEELKREKDKLAREREEIEREKYHLKRLEEEKQKELERQLEEKRRQDELERKRRKEEEEEKQKQIEKMKREEEELEIQRKKEEEQKQKQIEEEERAKKARENQERKEKEEQEQKRQELENKRSRERKRYEKELEHRNQSESLPSTHADDSRYSKEHKYQRERGNRFGERKSPIRENSSTRSRLFNNPPERRGSSSLSKSNRTKIEKTHEIDKRNEDSKLENRRVKSIRTQEGYNRGSSSNRSSSRLTPPHIPSKIFNKDFSSSDSEEERFKSNEKRQSTENRTKTTSKRAFSSEEETMTESAKKRRIASHKSMSPSRSVSENNPSVKSKETDSSKISSKIFGNNNGSSHLNNDRNKRPDIISRNSKGNTNHIESKEVLEKKYNGIRKKRQFWGEIARNKKHESDDIMKKERNLKKGGIIGLDSLLTYLIAFDLEDKMSLSIKNVPSERNWDTLFPYLKHLETLHEDNNWHLISGLCCYISAIIHLRVAHYLHLSLGANEGKDTQIPIMTRIIKHNEEAHQCLLKGERQLNIRRVRTHFPKTFSKRNDEPQPQLKSENGFRPLEDKYYLPLQCSTSLREITSFGYSVMKEWADNNDISCEWAIDTTH